MSRSPRCSIAVGPRLRPQQGDKVEARGIDMSMRFAPAGPWLVSEVMFYNPDDECLFLIRAEAFLRINARRDFGTLWRWPFVGGRCGHREAA